MVIRAGSIELVDKSDPGNLVPVGLSPYGFALRFHPFHSGKNHHGSIKHAQTPFHFGREINMPRCVDQVDLMIIPGKGGGCRRDGDSPLPFVGPEIHDRFTVMHFPDLVTAAGVKQETLGRRCFAGIDMSDDPNIPHSIERCQSHSILRPEDSTFTAQFYFVKFTVVSGDRFNAEFTGGKD